METLIPHPARWAAEHQGVRLERAGYRHSCGLDLLLDTPPLSTQPGTPCHPCSRHMADAQAVLHSHADLPADVMRRIFARAADHYGAPLSVKDRYAVLGGT